MTGTADPPDVRRDDEYHLRRFVAARTIGDQTAMREHWDALMTINHPRITALVTLEAKGRLDPDERQDAVQEASVRISVGLYRNFKGTEMGQWVNAAKKAVHFACIDVQDAAKRVHAKESSFDDTRIDDHGQEHGRYAKGLYDEAELRRIEGEEDFFAQEELEEYRAVLAWALPQLSDKLRAVAERDLDEQPTEQIMEELGVSQDTVYQRRRRYLLELKQLRKRYPS